jgi:hypothetical protein
MAHPSLIALIESVALERLMIPDDRPRARRHSEYPIDPSNSPG